MITAYSSGYAAPLPLTHPLPPQKKPNILAAPLPVVRLFVSYIGLIGYPAGEQSCSQTQLNLHDPPGACFLVRNASPLSMLSKDHRASIKTSNAICLMLSNWRAWMQSCSGFRSAAFYYLIGLVLSAATGRCIVSKDAQKAILQLTQLMTRP